MFHETLRCFPSVLHLAKPVKTDVVLPARRFTKDQRTNKVTSSEEYNVNVPKGMWLMLDIVACHYNCKLAFVRYREDTPSHCHFHSALHWGEDVYEFKPERFIDTDTYRWPRDACMCHILTHIHYSHLDSFRLLCGTEKLYWTAVCSRGECVHSSVHCPSVSDPCSRGIAVTFPGTEEESDAGLVLVCDDNAET